MIEIALSAIPNQSFSIRLDDHLYDIRLRAAKNIMAVDIVRDGVLIETGIRAEAGFPLIPYQYQESGNFIIVTENDEYPDYTKFGITQTLVYVTIAELGVIRAGT